MTLNLITYAIVKAQLGLADDTQQTAIEAMIPIVSNDVRRILNTNFDRYYDATLTSGSANLSIDCKRPNSFTSRTPFNIGQCIYSPSLAIGTYITAYNPSTSIYTLSASATADGSYIYPTIEISQFPVISKMIYYKVSKKSTSDATSKAVSSISYGPVSKTFADGEINTTYDYPQKLLNDLGPRRLKVF